MFAAFPGRTTALAVLAILSGALPAVFAILVGALTGLIPAVARSGLASPAGHRTVACLIAIAAVLIVTELAAGAQEVVSTDLYRKLDGELLGRVMAAALARDDLSLFDDPELAACLDRGVQLARYGPGELASGLSAQWTVRTQGLAAAALVAYYWPAAAIVLGAIWLLAGRALQASYYRAEPFWTDPLRRARYIQRIGLRPEFASEIRVFGLTRWLAGQYGREWSAVMSQLQRARQTDHRRMALLGGIVLAAHLAVLLLLARAALAGALSVPALIVILQGVFGMALIASLLGDTWIENGSVPVPDVLALERVATASPPGGRRPSAGRPAAGLPRREIRFADVSFRYPGGGQLALDGLSLQLPAGRSIAIVGLNGAGKTTLVRLLTGLCQPTAGSITVDGISLPELDLASWRRQLAVIFQDFVRYELPLADNIRFGGVEQGQLTASELTELARAAGAADLITELPAGTQTMLSARFPGGVELSGGQWQRIAFARALMAVRAGARLLVMDEPTAHLDVRAEAELYTRFLSATTGLTTVVISHRFSTVRHADRIVVLSAGRVEEDGSHAELMAADGRYARLFRLQARNYGGAGDG